MVLIPVPASDGLKEPSNEFTPAPEYIPPGGMPPFSKKGLAFKMVTVSKQEVNETKGRDLAAIDTGLLAAGFPVAQVSLDVKTQRMLSLFTGT